MTTPSHEPDVDAPVVTGIGLVTPLGPSAPATWAGICAGRSGARPFEAPGGLSDVLRCAASVSLPGLAPRLRVAKHAKFAGRATSCLLHAVEAALEDARFDRDAVDPWRVGVFVGSGQTGLEASTFFDALDAAWADDQAADYKHVGGPASRLIDPYFSLRTLSNVGAALVAIEVDARGPSENMVQGDCASVLALRAACDALDEHRCDLAIVGACDSLLTPETLRAYAAAGVLCRSDAARAAGPFDVARTGPIPGEGAAVLVVERGDHARRRGAVIRGRLGAVGTASSTEPDAEAKAAGRAVDAAVDEALGARPHGAAQLGLAFIVAHGIGTYVADRLELAWLDRRIGDAVPVTAIKGATGYMGAASGLAEIAVALLALDAATVPPIARLERADAHDGDLVRRSARPVAEGAHGALCLSWTWAGQCTAVMVERGHADAPGSTT